MSCYYISENSKKEIKTFVDQFNALLREHKMYIDFMDGTLYHDTKYAGMLEDCGEAVSIEDADGIELYESSSNED